MFMKVQHGDAGQYIPLVPKSQIDLCIYDVTKWERPRKIGIGKLGLN